MTERDSKRRKVRKGTHSCWECRRRKIRCQFATSDDRVCIGCRGRATTCISQEYVDEQPPPQPDRRLAQRLGRLEELMEKLVDQIAPGSMDTMESFQASPSGSASDMPVDMLESSVADGPSVLTLFGAPGCEQSTFSLPTPESEPTVPCLGSTCKYDKTSRTLHALFPSQHDISIITSSSAGALFLIQMLYSEKEYQDGNTETPASLALIPPATSHPALLAKRLLQLCVCLQQLPPAFNEKLLWLKKSIPETVAEWTTTISNLVTSNDDLIGSSEGLECLILQILYLSNAGNLRKAWLTTRRASSLAQLMGLDRKGSKPIRSCDPRSDPTKRPSASRLWFKINFCDRYLSLMLGLPMNIADDDWAEEDCMVDETPMERFERVSTVIIGRIIQRNRAKATEAYGITQAIDCELEAAAKTMGSHWWKEPKLDRFGTPLQIKNQMHHIMLQIHYHTLLIFLHIPYMLRSAGESRYDYSKTICLQSSREVLERFISFRTVNVTAFSCRHVDYASLVAAMTLLLGYLTYQCRGQDNVTARQRDLDRDLVRRVKAKMEDISVANHDKLSGESADIINQLLPIIEHDGACTGGMEGPLQLDVPYLGKININPTVGHASQDPAGEVRSIQSTAPGPEFNARPDPLTLDPALQQMSDEALFAPTAGDGQVMTLDCIGDLDLFEFPELTAEASDWTFQGVDTTYWSLLNGGLN